MYLGHKLIVVLTCTLNRYKKLRKKYDHHSFMIFYRHVCITFLHGRYFCCTDPCLDITAFTSGNVSYYSDGTTTYASFFCASGYYRVGGSTLRCLTSGDWDGSPPLCCKS